MGRGPELKQPQGVSLRGLALKFLVQRSLYSYLHYNLVIHIQRSYVWAMNIRNFSLLNAITILLFSLLRIRLFSVTHQDFAIPLVTCQDASYHTSYPLPQLTSDKFIMFTVPNYSSVSQSKFISLCRWTNPLFCQRHGGAVHPGGPTGSPSGFQQKPLSTLLQRLRIAVEPMEEPSNCSAKASLRTTVFSRNTPHGHPPLSVKGV